MEGQYSELHDAYQGEQLQNKDLLTRLRGDLHDVSCVFAEHMMTEVAYKLYHNLLSSNWMQLRLILSCCRPVFLSAQCSSTLLELSVCHYTV